jgi:hypothetical protein
MSGDKLAMAEMANSSVFLAVNLYALFCHVYVQHLRWRLDPLSVLSQF